MEEEAKRGSVNRGWEGLARRERERTGRSLGRVGGGRVINSQSLYAGRIYNRQSIRFLGNDEWVQAALKEAGDRNDSKEVETWRRRLHDYLDLLFLKDSVAGSVFHGLQVPPPLNLA